MHRAGAKIVARSIVAIFAVILEELYEGATAGKSRASLLRELRPVIGSAILQIGPEFQPPADACNMGRVSREDPATPSRLLAMLNVCCRNLRLANWSIGTCNSERDASFSGKYRGDASPVLTRAAWQKTSGSEELPIIYSASISVKKPPS